jgi:nicotinamidase-related amidase
MRPTLIVVDMQYQFEASVDPNVVIGVTCEIVKAREYGSPIVVVEYEGCGRSHSGFLNLIRNYRRKAIIKKWDDDGSAEIIRTLKRRQFNPFHLRVCGVNSDACVLSTVQGLLAKLNQTEIEVVKQACGPPINWRRHYARHPNLRLV